MAKTPSYITILNESFATLDARLIQLQQQRMDLFDSIGLKVSDAIALIQRYIHNIPRQEALVRIEYSKQLFAKIDWVELEKWLIPTDYGIDTYVEYNIQHSTHEAIIEGEKPFIEKFFKTVPELVKKEEISSPATVKAKELIIVDFTVPQLASLVKFLQDSKVIDKQGAANLTTLIIENFSTKALKGKPITRSSFKTEKSNGDNIADWHKSVSILRDHLNKILTSIKL